jgi:hypothetical protein
VSFDVAIVAAVLAAQGVFKSEELRGTVLLGELGLDGRLRPVRGVLPATLAAQQAGFTVRDLGKVGAVGLRRGRFRHHNPTVRLIAQPHYRPVFNLPLNTPHSGHRPSRAACSMITFTVVVSTQDAELMLKTEQH